MKLNMKLNLHVLIVTNYWVVLAKRKANMLVLTRKVNEKILFPEVGIEITIVKITGSNESSRNCRIGIEAPPHIKIVRKEIINKESKETLPHNKKTMGDEQCLH
jgi:carbon storage regulator CsrA